MFRKAIGWMFLSLMGLLVCISTAGASFPNPSLNGIFAINSTYVRTIKGVTTYQVDPAMLNNPLVDGIAIRVFWSDIEPSDGVFNWSSVDSDLAQVAAAGKVATLRIMPGYSTPAWLYQEGAQAFNFIWNQSTWGPAFCSVASIPVPWDPIFQSKFAAMIQAFGARYNSNPAVAGIKISGINTDSEETHLPLQVNVPLTNGQTGCTSNNDVANWQAIGYTRTLAVSAWEQIAQMFQQAFPNQPLIGVFQPGGFPPIDSNGNLISGYNGADTIASQNIITYEIANLGNQFVLQNDALTSTWNWSYQASFAGQIAIGHQTLAALNSNLPAAMTNVINLGTDFLELYPGDINNPSLQSALTAAHNALG
jgi:hypothetical protein